MLRFFDRTLPEAAPGPVEPEEVYRDLRLPRGATVPGDRPYTLLNMVATVDGKVIVGGRRTSWTIGSATDHALYHRLEQQSDGLLLGAGLVRTDDPSYPRLDEAAQAQRASAGARPALLWAVVSTAGAFSSLPRGFRGGRENTALFTTAQIPPARRAELEPHTRVFVCGERRVDPLVMGTILRTLLGVQLLTCIGGPHLNATLLEGGAVDELFLTLAPKLQGGAHGVTLLEGASYPPDALLPLDLLSCYADGSELYLRYRLPRGPQLPGPADAPSS